MYQLVPASTSQYQLVPDGSSWYQHHNKTHKTYKSTIKLTKLTKQNLQSLQKADKKLTETLQNVSKVYKTYNFARLGQSSIWIWTASWLKGTSRALEHNGSPGLTNMETTIATRLDGGRAFGCRGYGTYVKFKPPSAVDHRYRYQRSALHDGERSCGHNDRRASLKTALAQ